MTNDLETMLRTSLHERADDVEPTPELWQQVQRRVARRRAMPLLVWTAAGVAAAVTAFAVVPGLVERMDEGFVIDPAQSPTAPASPGEEAPGPVAAAPLTHYVAVVDGRLVLRGVDGSEEVLWEGESEVRTLAVRPGSAPDDLTVAFVTSSEGMLDLRVTSSGTAATTAVPFGPDLGDAAVVPTPAWSPDGRTVGLVEGSTGDLVLVDVDASLGDSDVEPSRLSLGDVAAPDQLRLQDWASTGDGEVLSFTALGTLYRAPIGEVGETWDVGELSPTDTDDYVVDVATHPDGRLYRLLAGEGASSGDAEDAGLALFLDDEPVVYPDLATGDPSAVWMTAVDGGAFVGLGSDARRIHVGDRRHDMLPPLQGISYAAWVPVAGDGAGPAPTIDAPTSEPAVTGGVAPYVAVDPEGRVAVHTGDGGEREVILGEEHWDSAAGVTVLDVSVRPGSSFGEVSGVVLLATEGGPELSWFRAAAGETSVRRMEGPFGLGPTADAPSTAPTFAPDGRHLAWVERDDAGGWTLRTLGVDDDGPTDEDAGMGIDVDAEQLVLADWVWEAPAGDGPVRGSIHLVATGGDAGVHELPIERQGDDALAVTGSLERRDDLGADVADLGVRDGTFVTLVRGADGWLVRQDGRDIALPFAVEPGGSPLDLDLVGELTVVTRRPNGDAVVISADGEVTPLDAGRPVHGFDPVR